jgi:hypothetical protein
MYPKLSPGNEMSPKFPPGNLPPYLASEKSGTAAKKARVNRRFFRGLFDDLFISENNAANLNRFPSIGLEQVNERSLVNDWTIDEVFSIVVRRPTSSFIQKLETKVLVF